MRVKNWDYRELRERIADGITLRQFTDFNTLLWDVVRVLTRLIGRLAKALELRRIAGFRDRSRAAHRRMYEIQRMTTRQRQGAGSRHIATYRALIAIAEEVVAAAQAALRRRPGYAART
jgi:transposase, IS5 family